MQSLADSAFMRRLATWLCAGLLGLALAAALLLTLAIDGQPRVPYRDDVSPADVDRAVVLLRQHDPRRVPTGQLRSLTLSERDVDLLVQYGARRWLGANTQVRLRPGQLILQASAALPGGRWLNLDLALRQNTAMPEIERLRVGRLPLPDALAMPLLRAVAARRGLQPDAWLAVGWIEHVAMRPGSVSVSYRIDADTVPRLRAAIVAPPEQQRLRAYQERLLQLSRGVPGRVSSVSELLVPLFALAAQRTGATGDAVAENRAALLILALFANHQPLGRLVPAAYQWTQPLPVLVKMRRRHDSAQHFLVSAVIAAQAGTPLADAVGLWKELADARRGGSGFSFNDLGADRAGTRFGELAVRDPRRLQTLIASGVRDEHLMPDVSDLPEGLPESEFVARFGGVGGAGYNRLLATIESRIDALPMFQ